MAAAIGANSGQDRTLNRQSKQQTILKPAQVDQYQVPFVGQYSNYSNSFGPPLPPPPLPLTPIFHQPTGAYQQHQMTSSRHHNNQQQQQRLSGAHTISRSKDLHKQYGNQHAIAMKPHPAQLVYYDQPYLGYGTLVANAAPPLLANGGPYAAVSLAVRAPKERGPIPASLIDGAANGGTVGSALMRHYAADMYQKQQQQQRLHKSHSTKQLIYQDHPASLLDLNARFNKPLCRCRVMYLGSSVPHITKNGLHGIQEPLRHLYPEEKFSTDSLRRRTQQQQQQQQNMTIDISHLSSSLGIDSWLSVWSNGLLLENVDEFGRDIRRFFPIESLHYCAAVRFFDTTTLMSEKQLVESTDSNNNNNTGQDSSLISSSSGIDNEQHENQQLRQQQKRAGVVRFLPLDAPIFQYPNMMDANHPPVFSAILRRTTGIKVLECHAFICRRDAASNALVRCCTHAYADFLSAKRMSAEFGVEPTTGSAAMPSHYSSGCGGNGRRSSRLDQRDDQLRTTSAKQRRNETLNHQYNQVVGKGPQETVDRNEHSHSNKSSTLNRRRNAPEDQRRRPARSLSTGGTNSQEMTHSDENSLEVDSEDNYAIISRHGAASSAKVNRSKENSADDSAGSNMPTAITTANEELKRRGRKSKGSSKSLFRGFMPNELPAEDQGSIARRRSSGHRSQQQCGADRSATEFGDQTGSRLSYSLDQLQAGFNANCCPDGECLGELSSGRELQAVRDSVKYSIVANKQRRHSKSMQQLVNVTGQRQLETGKENRPNNMPVSFAWNQTVSSRRAASCQDIAHDVGGSLSRASSCSSRRRSSRRSQRRRSESRRSSMSSLHPQQNSLAGSQTELNVSGHRADRRSQQRARQLDPNGYIYATCNESPQPPTQLDRPARKGESGPVPMPVRILRADCCIPIEKTKKSARGPIDSSSSSGSVRTKRSSKLSKTHQQQQQMPINSAHVQQDPLGGYYQFMQPPPPLSHRTSCYSPTGTALMFCGPTPNYHQPIYGLPPPSHANMSSPTPAPTYYLNPSQHQQQQYPPQALFHPAASPLYTGAPASMMALNGYVMTNAPQTAASKSSTMKRTSNKSPGTTAKDSTMKRKTQTLATRFRCLSPPLSFLTGGGDRNSTSARTNPTHNPNKFTSQTTRTDQVQEHFGDRLDQNNNRQSVASASSQLTYESDDQISPSQIISARPGFLTTTVSASNGSFSSEQLAVQQVVPAQNRRRAPNSCRPKMSWIKRLSLTLSSGSAAQPRQQATGKATKAVASTEQTSAEFYRNIQEVDQQQLGATISDEIVKAQNLEDLVERDREADLDQQAGQSKLDESDANQLVGETSEQINTTPSQVIDTQETKETKSKHKKGGFFSGSLTLGRRSRVKSKP